MAIAGWAEIKAGFKSMMHSNESITGFVQPMKDLYRNPSGTKNVFDRVKNAVRENPADAASEINVGKAASLAVGSYMGVSAGYRVLSGGGLYKDGSGNTDLIGLPFV